MRIFGQGFCFAKPLGLETAGFHAGLKQRHPCRFRLMLPAVRGFALHRETQGQNAKAFWFRIRELPRGFIPPVKQRPVHKHFPDNPMS
jgi:hypothetical protein